VVVQAHLLALATRKDADERLRSKFHLVKRLYAEGYSRQQVVDVFRFIDWLMDLPEAHERLFWDELAKYEEGKKMPYVTSVERIGIEKGMQQGLQQGMQQGIVQGLLEGIELAVEVKFGGQGLTLMPLIQRIEAPEKLKAVKAAVRTAKDLSQLKALILEVEKVQ
jgi:flagellar biosynthesis/type III secretory pathway protein FliH